MTRPPGEPDFEAQVDALPPESGGRSVPFPSGYRAIHDLGHPDGLNDAHHEYPDGGTIGPGESGRALLWLLYPELQAGRLFVGMQFTVQEGQHIVAHGTITRVVNSVLQKRL